MLRSIATGSISDHGGLELQLIREEMAEDHGIAEHIVQEGRLILNTTSTQNSNDNANHNLRGDGMLHEDADIEEDAEYIHYEVNVTEDVPTTAANKSDSDSNDFTNTSIDTATLQSLRGPMVGQDSVLRNLARSDREAAPPLSNKPEYTFELAGPSLIRPEHKGLLLTTCDSFLLDWCYTILIGFLVVSFWRGGWLLLDIILCNQPGTAGLINAQSFCFIYEPTSSLRFNTAIQTLIAGYILLGMGLVMLSNGCWNPSKVFVKDLPTKTKFYKAPIRVMILLLLGWGTVCLWRTIWYFFDYYIYPDQLTKSYLVTTFGGIALCACLQSTASLLAPPAIFLMDGPSHLPPPIGVTIVTSYRSIALPAKVAREKTAKDPMWLVMFDVFISYVILPIGVVGFWRGLWMLLDTWLWGFTSSYRDLYFSLLWSALLALSALFLGSEDIAQHFSPEKTLRSAMAIKIANGVFGRLRTLVLAFGAVNFWRVVWYTWDEFLGKTHAWSGALSHVLGIFGLLCLGCLSCITAPPSTLGVDAIADPDCSDEPLFHNVPVPAEAIYLFGIARPPESVLRHLRGLDGSDTTDASIMADPTILADVTIRPQLTISPEVYGRIDDLLVQDEYVCSHEARSTRFTEQTASRVQLSTRNQSSSALRLSSRSMRKRTSSQFFRSR